MTEREILAALTVVSERAEGEFPGKELEKIARSCIRYGSHPWGPDAWSYASRVVRRFNLGASACLVLTELYKVVGDDGVVSIGQRLLSTKTHLNVGTVGATLDQLAAHGLLRVVRGGRGKRSTIHLALQPLGAERP